MNNPIPLDLARTVLAAYWAAEGSEHDMMRAALAAHLSELAALPAVRDLALADRREADVEAIEREAASWMRDGGFLTARSFAHRIAAALSDATNGGHWEEGVEAYHRAMAAGLPRRSEVRGPTDAAVELNYGWVPADPDAALIEHMAQHLASDGGDLVDDTYRDIARAHLDALREVATVTLRADA